MNKNWFSSPSKTLALGLLGMVVSASSFAQSTSATAASSSSVDGTSVSQQQVPSSEGFKLPVSLSLNSTFYGGPVADPLAGYTMDDTLGLKDDPNASEYGMNKSPLYTRNIITIGRQLNDMLTLSANADFYYTFRNSLGEENFSNYRSKDWYLRLKAKNIYRAKIDASTADLTADVRYYMPTSEHSWRNDSLGALRVSMYPGINLGESIFRLEALAYGKVFLQTHARDEHYRRMKLLEFYAGPQLTANFTDTFNAFALYEAVVQANTSLELNSDFKPGAPHSALTDIQLGVEWTPISNISIKPYANWYTAAPIKSTNWNLELTASL